MKIQDDNWLLAESLQRTPAPSTDFRPGQHGVVTARAHPTGWFISARYRCDLTADDLEDFAQFVRVRAYLLLANGAHDSVWERVEDGSWVAVCDASRLDLPEVVDAVH